MDDAVRRAVTAGADKKDLRAAAIAAGMRPMLLDGLHLAAQGVTSVEEVLRVAPLE